MIVTILDQVQKLLGRGFVIVAFVPTLVASALGIALITGTDTILETVQRWQQQDLKESVFEILALVVSVALVAYVLYGLRGAVRQFYAGDLPLLLRWLSLPGLRWQRYQMRRCQAALNECGITLDVTAWAVLRKFPLNPYSSVALDEATAAKKLGRARISLAELLTCIREKKRVNEDTCRDLLVNAHVLAANQAKLDQAGPSIAAFIEELKTSYKKYQPLKEATNTLYHRAAGEWSRAYASRYWSYPDNERWLRPTAFGNIMNVLEVDTHKRYGIYLSGLWPRLMHVIAGDFQKRIEDTSIYLDFTLMMSFLALFEFFIAVFAAWQRSSLEWYWRILPPILLLAGAYLFYRLAVQAVRQVREESLAAVDLFRLKLLDALDIQRPANPQEERQIWAELSRFFIQADAVNPEIVRYKLPENGDTKPDAKDDKPRKSLLERLLELFT